MGERTRNMSLDSCPGRPADAMTPEPEDLPSPVPIPPPRTFGAGACIVILSGSENGLPPLKKRRQPLCFPGRTPEAVAYMRPLMKDVDAFHKQKLVESGMTLIEYDDEFYDSVLALEGVRALRYYINKNQSAGLGALLTEELNR